MNSLMANTLQSLALRLTAYTSALNKVKAMSAYYLARHCSKYYAISTHLTLMQPHKVGIIIKPILKMKKHAQKGE